MKETRIFTKNLIQFLQEMRLPLWYIQLFISFVSFGIVSWRLTTFYKVWVIGERESALYPWTRLFYHPVESDQLNYLVVCLAVGICGVLFYFLKNKRTLNFLKIKAENFRLEVLPLALGSSLALIWGSSCFPGSRLSLLGLMFVSGFPFLIDMPIKKVLMKRWLFVLFSISLFCLISIEPFRVVSGPVFLMNEYPDVYGETYVKGEVVNNKSFLESIKPYVCATQVLVRRISRLEEGGPDDFHSFFIRNKQRDLELLQKRVVSTVEIDRSPGLFREVSFSGRSEEDSCIANMSKLDLEGIKQFYLANHLEYNHQNLGRGQINHFGHILNPINEYELGKRLADIYMQYGLGNTLLMKWTMDVFGGTSIHNYYKTYIFYIIYYLFFLCMLVFLFKDGIYILGVYATIVASFFIQGYIAFLLGPGLIPSIHLLDTCVIISLIAFFRKNEAVFMGIGMTLCVASILINRHFGLGIFAAWMAAQIFYIYENTKYRARYKWVIVLISCVIIAVLTLYMSNAGSLSTVFPYFWAGLFSWPAPHWITIATIIYLIVSYIFLILLKEQRFALKYIYVFVFVYAQVFLLYFYWSGLLNHLPSVIPFFCLQIFIMFYIVQNHAINLRFVQRLISGLVVVLTVLSLGAMVFAGRNFYQEKMTVDENFKSHKIYAWEFDKANVLTTMPANSIKKSIELIHKYSRKEEPGIVILSKYDGLLPFLSERYSLMPFFESTVYLFSEREYLMMLNVIKKHKPRYLFVDTEIHNHTKDLWETIYNIPAFIAERDSRLGRYSLLKKLLHDIENDYEKIDQTDLISVYQRYAGRR